MKLRYFFIILIWSFFSIGCSSEANETPIPQDQEPLPAAIYFPPLDGSDTWDTKSVADLGWNDNQLQPLLDFLEENNSKSFIIVHTGKIVVEAYMNGHSNSSLWYWASAGKTLTTTVTGIAQNEGLLNINDKVSDYIGTGWTSTPLEKENLITSKHLLSMTSGLDDSLGDDISTENLQYLADAGNRWAYHNVYVKLQDVVASASDQTWSNYFNTTLKNKIGMSGAWIQNNDYSVYWSDTRSMARFGLMISANGKWENTPIISEDFLNVAINTSQPLNEAYGYMWWLNGKSTFRLPQSQLEFQGELIPNAPSDMYCALGRDDQKIYIVPSKNIVVIRMGETANDVNFALSSFDNDLWEKINALIN
ncbi:CubicO group peptidase, beta-lactamase class C family [Formosa sp. Hel1_31_208]|uniref:serine hydrolase domain-containing protein n=1 Tax=Formosa sp. Hel1_31_208 TaxID=1798225 RepID=UPI00087CF765|nr:serine hydrolase [Formosa sp. Hel1_31_208]SDS71419.1 CubicO group peptidase, beta-lactamase class C family [Formosa sp. Hel1_31_208]